MVVFFIFCKNDNVLYFRVCPYFNLNQVVVYVYTRTCWRRGIVVSGVRHINEVNPRRARLVLGWVTVFGRAYHLSM